MILLASYHAVGHTQNGCIYVNQKGPSTHVINTESLVKRWSTTIGAEELATFLAVQL
jgi:hypothetical protein